MTVNLPFDSLATFVNGKKTYGAVVAGLIVYFGQPYLPFLTPDLAAELTTGLLGAALVFLRSGSKNDAANAVEQIQTILATPVQPDDKAG